MKILKLAARKIYLFGRERHIGFFCDKNVIKHITSLNHNIYSEARIEEYYSGKVYKSLLFIFGTMLITLLMFVKSTMNADISGDGYVVRSSFDEGARNVEIIVEKDEGTYSHNIEVRPRKLSESEINELYEEFIQVLCKKILGKNVGADEVNENLSLISEIENYPFQIRWTSDRPEVISSNGCVYVGEEPERVTLTAHIGYEDFSAEYEIILIVRPKSLSEAEREYADMQEFLERSENENREKELWEIPTVYEGLPIRIRKKFKGKVLIIPAAGIILSILLYFISDKDLSDDVRKKREVMKREYGDIVQKLTLYIGAGMTVRGAFQKLAADYETAALEGSAIRPTYEEIVHTCRELKKGVSEAVAYERFGVRTGVQEYIRLSALLTQNLKKGSGELLFRLREEADRAMEEKLQSARKLGEEANTKLLLPMVMMLLVVMVMIMLPAFSSTSL
ncbi:MAG: type II secretion system F family protein [Lachnospiraceae bacterium]|nr:type II secretion system F family protein [Lachnospiraceae bacterium]